MSIIKNCLLAFGLSVAAITTDSLSVNSANAQSFSCANAKIPSELAICNNENLLIKDERLASLFAEAIVNAGETRKVQTISAQHSLWLKKRNDCRVDFECLEKRYDERLNKLSPEFSFGSTAF